MEFQKGGHPAEITPAGSLPARQQTTGAGTHPSPAKSSAAMFVPTAGSTVGENQVAMFVPAGNTNWRGKHLLILGLIAAGVFLVVCVAWRFTRNPAASPTQAKNNTGAHAGTGEGVADNSSTPSAERTREETVPNDRGSSHNTPNESTQQANLSALRVGQSGEWIGELQRVWGMVGKQDELHFRLHLDDAHQQGTLLEAVVPSAAFSQEVLDYESSEERTEAASEATAGSQPRIIAGDKVVVAGVVVAPEEFEYRITPRGTPFVRLTHIERLGESASRAKVGEQRPRNSFRRNSASYVLADVLRINPRQGSSLSMAGVFQRWEKSSETILLALGVEGRAAEVHFPKVSFTDYMPGERVELEANTTGEIYQRVEENVVWQRPYLTGKTIRRPNKPGDVTQVVDPAASVSPPQTVASAEKPRLAEPNHTESATTPVKIPPKDKDRLYSDVFIATEEGATALWTKGEWHVLKLPAPIPKQIKSAFVDRQDACWLGGEGGAVVLDGQAIKQFARDPGFPRGTISCILEDHRDQMWVGSWEDGIACLESNDWRNRQPGIETKQDRWKQFREQDGLCLNNVNALAEDGAGRLWIGACNFDPPGGGISILDKGQFQTNLLPKEVAQLSVQSMDQSPQGDVYIGFIGGMLIVEPNFQAKVNQALPQRTPQATFFDSQNRLWAGTWGGGVVQIDTKDASVMKPRALPAAGHVREMCEDADGTLWVAGLEGLWKLENEDWQSVSLPRGISRVGVVEAIPTAVAQQLLRYSTTPQSGGSSPAEPTGTTNTTAAEENNTPPARNTDDPTGTLEDDLLTDTGRLKETLRLEEFLNATVDGGNVLLTIETYQVVAISKDGRWRSSWRITGGTSVTSGKKLSGLDQGQLEESDLHDIAAGLMGNDLLNLPKDITERRKVVARPGTVMRRIVVTFGTKKYQATYQITDSEGTTDRRKAAQAEELARIEAISDLILAIPTDRPGSAAR